ncbi:MAG TPA: hypothetical protein PKJ98_09695 [Verrucomicrobiota bacterium]|nr:hypothetical protein [Verrucomicrobiota bacterium]
MSAAAVCGGLLLAATLMLGCGCQSLGGSDSKPLASITIRDVTESRVRLTLAEVFESAGYEARVLSGPELRFEKPGSFSDNLMRGGWLSSETVIRARLRITRQEPDALLISCRAATVQYPGDSVMEEEHAVHWRGSFQKLLEETARRLQPQHAPHE